MIIRNEYILSFVTIVSETKFGHSRKNQGKKETHIFLILNLLAHKVYSYHSAPFLKVHPQYFCF